MFACALLGPGGASSQQSFSFYGVLDGCVWPLSTLLSLFPGSPYCSLLDKATSAGLPISGGWLIRDTTVFRGFHVCTAASSGHDMVLGNRTTGSLEAFPCLQSLVGPFETRELSIQPYQRLYSIARLS
jgi:hypothetical protein